MKNNSPLKTLKEKLKFESKIVRQNSLEVLKEFEKIYNLVDLLENDTIYENVLMNNFLKQKQE